MTNFLSAILASNFISICIIFIFIIALCDGDIEAGIALSCYLFAFLLIIGLISYFLLDPNMIVYKDIILGVIIGNLIIVPEFLLGKLFNYICEILF